MKHTLACLGLILPAAHAATSFTAAVDSDFNNVANWDNGLPSNGGNDGTVAAPAVLSANFNTATGISYHMDINSSMSTGAFEFQHRSGSNGRDVRVGNGATGSLTINDGGRLDIAGAGSDLFIGFNGGTGTVFFENNATFQVQKAIEVLSGSLTFAPQAISATSLQDELVVDDAGTLAFQFDASFNYFTLAGSSFGLELGATSTLDLSFAATPSINDVFILANDITGFSGVAGGTGTGIFGNVNASGLAPGQSIEVDYGTLTAGELAITIVPETSSALLSLLGAGLLLRRRRSGIVAS